VNSSSTMDAIGIQPSAAPGKQRIPAMAFILLTVLIDMVAIGLIVPVLPALVGTFTSSAAQLARRR
jgi:DHA1 family tetracycline resistance protein-like MFS transporter